jgi:ATP-dependent DNA helicase PIF1
MDSLSQEQEYAFEQFKQRKSLFISGPGGTGKTRLIRHLVDYMDRADSRKYQVCALTGCASLLLDCNARTIHSWSGIKLAKGSIDQVIASVYRNKYALKTWRKIDVLIIDEVSMMSKKIFDILEQMARQIRCDSKPFGNIQVVLTGDFYQLPPVETYGEPDTAAFCFESERWPAVFNPESHILLKTVFRQKDPLYCEILSQVREGNIKPEMVEILKTYVNRKCETGGCTPTKIFPIRAKVDMVNTQMFSKIKEEE